MPRIFFYNYHDYSYRTIITACLQEESERASAEAKRKVIEATASETGVIIAVVAAEWRAMEAEKHNGGRYMETDAPPLHPYSTPPPLLANPTQDITQDPTHGQPPQEPDGAPSATVIVASNGFTAAASSSPSIWREQAVKQVRDTRKVSMASTPCALGAATAAST